MKLTGHKKVEINNIRKYLGFLILFIGTIAILYGISIYLSGTQEKFFNKIAFIGWILILLTLFFGNPIAKIENKAIYAIKFPNMEKYYASRKEIKQMTLIFCWLLTLSSILFFIWYRSMIIFSFSTSFPSPMEDLIIRFLSFGFFLTLIIYFIFLSTFFFKEILSGFLFWFFGFRNKKYKYNSKFWKLEVNIFVKELKSPLCLFLYAMLGITVFIIHFLTQSFSFEELKTAILFLLSLNFLLISLILGYEYNVSFYKTCKKLNLEYNKEFKNQGFLTAISLLSSYFSIILFVIISVKALKVLINPLFRIIFPASLPTKGSFIFEIIQEKKTLFLDITEFLFNKWFIYAFLCSFGIFILVFYYYSLSRSYSKISRKRKKRYLTEVYIFLFVLICTQIPVIITEGSIDWSYLPLGFILAFIATMLEKSLKTMVGS